METILIVEDDVVLGQLLSEELTRGGWRVALAADPVDALEHLKAQKMDVLLTDFHLCTDLNGVNITQWAESNMHSTLRCVMSGAVIPVEDVLKPLGVEIFLSKPFDPSKLSGQLREFLRDTGRVSR